MSSKKVRKNRNGNSKVQVFNLGGFNIIYGSTKAINKYIRSGEYMENYAGKGNVHCFHSPEYSMADIKAWVKGQAEPDADEYADVDISEIINPLVSDIPVIIDLKHAMSDSRRREAALFRQAMFDIQHKVDKYDTSIMDGMSDKTQSEEYLMAYAESKEPGSNKSLQEIFAAGDKGILNVFETLMYGTNNERVGV